VNDIEWYLAKIPPEHASQPKFMAEVRALLQPLVDAQALAADLPNYFDIDNEEKCVGAQLDILGEWIGRARTIPVPLTNPWFTLGDPLRGFGRGVWRNRNVNAGVTYTRLEDGPYRRLLRAKAIANEWDGTAAEAQRVLDAFLPPATGAIPFIDDQGFALAPGVDTCQRIMKICVSGNLPSIIDLEILDQNLIGLKPATVELQVRVTSRNAAPVFGLGVDNQFIGGFGRGAWGVAPAVVFNADPALIDGEA
jgi:hypothetical protein